jgi:hypothetical protein
VKPNKMLMLMSILLAVVLTATMYVRAGAQVVTPRPADLRYQALLNEPIATPNRGAVVAGTSAMLVKDRLTGQCFLAVTIGSSIGLSPAQCGQ